MFNTLIGNDANKALLLRLADAGRVPHSLLFAGPDGVGKKLFALELARLLICANSACGQCSVCSRIGVFDIPKAEKGDDFDTVFLSDHPDVGIVVPYKRNLRVGAIRELEREAHFRPFEADKRVFVVDDADKMNDSAANALLKTLEEPPETAYIILVTSRPDALLPTIRSRCQTVRFAPVAASSIESLLTETSKLSSADASVIARTCGGSVAKALSCDLAWFKDIRATMVDVLLATSPTDNLALLLAASERMSDAKNKERFEDCIAVLEAVIGDVLAVAKGGPICWLANQDIAEEIREIASRVTTTTVDRWIAVVEELQLNYVVNINRKVATDGMFVRMAAAQ